MQSIRIKEQIRLAAPGLSSYLGQIPDLNVLERRDVTVVDAVSSIVVGQMLSRHAANTILQRTRRLASTQGKGEIALLSADDLRTCGVSNAKVKAIKLFADQYYDDVRRYEGWYLLTQDELFRAVKVHWGLGDWTASMLALFYFAHEDVYPTNDGSIQRVTKRLLEQGITFDPSDAAPYRSYLALYLWDILDKSLI
jgi:DNA-3-methyladenine glycosylase II